MNLGTIKMWHLQTNYAFLISILSLRIVTLLETYSMNSLHFTDAVCTYENVCVNVTFNFISV